MKRLLRCASILLIVAGCSRLPALTPEILAKEEQTWNAHKPPFYRLVIDMTGDRVEPGHFEVEVRGSQVVSLRRNGLIISPNAGQDYSMEGLFRMLTQELGLVEKPAMLGAPPGYSVYATARFDDATGRLIRYRRIVGGTSNSIEVNVVDYLENGK